jgi:transposase
VYQGTIDIPVLEEFIRELIPRCGRWPQPNSVLTTNNASIHHSTNIAQMCSGAGLLLVYLAPYSPDLNPLEESFAEVKAFITKIRQVEVRVERGESMSTRGSSSARRSS